MSILACTYSTFRDYGYIRGTYVM